MQLNSECNEHNFQCNVMKETRENRNKNCWINYSKCTKQEKKSTEFMWIRYSISMHGKDCERLGFHPD